MNTIFFLSTVLLVIALASRSHGKDACRGTVNGKQYDLSKLAAALPNDDVVSASDNLGLVYTYKVCGSLGVLLPDQNDLGSSDDTAWTPLSSATAGRLA